MDGSSRMALDDSDYGSDFSVGEEGIVHQLLENLGNANVNADANATVSKSTDSAADTADASLEADIRAAVAAGLFMSSPVGQDPQNHVPSPAPKPSIMLSAHAKTPAPARGKSHSDAVTRQSLLGQQSLPMDGIQYPDLSRALNTIEPKAASIPEPPNEADDTRSPLERFRSFPKKPFSVSDLSSGAWCELQYWYTLTLLPGGKKTRTAAMRGGSRVHQTLEDEVHTTVPVNITTKEEAFALRLWNVVQGVRTLRETGTTRELEVWGEIDGEIINGIIDHLSYESPNAGFEEELDLPDTPQGKLRIKPKNQSSITDYLGSGNSSRRVYLTDVKTRGSTRLPSGAALRPARVQLFLYHRLLGNMVSGKVDFPAILNRYGLNAEARFSDAFMAQIGDLYDEVFYDADSEVEAMPSNEAGGAYPDASPDVSARMSPPSDLIRYRSIQQILPLLETELKDTFPQGAGSLGELLAVQYRHREDGRIIGNNSFPNDPEVLDGYMKRNLNWWRGQREAEGVSIEETYKCRFCDFAESCQWLKDKETEFTQKKRAKVQAAVHDTNPQSAVAI
ncbi:Uu.00g023960.m01.CDS01 [Anthostomella pinea]|uniref:Uu.00g023960.m01.CDS01 n=1 Tax=Anthostomella pinea TaxID=933095 RepID=A0AAI8W047_9PEZI|nr:Uu.00g023960.m01.CDS01 [Anthostomella pinea]